jgi:hypothetical protein
LGRLVTAASTSPPTMISGTANLLPNAAAARSMTTLAATTTSSDPMATIVSWRVARRGLIASVSSSSSSTTAEFSHAITAGDSGSLPSAERWAPRTAP